MSQGLSVWKKSKAFTILCSFRSAIVTQDLCLLNKVAVLLNPAKAAGFQASGGHEKHNLILHVAQKHSLHLRAQDSFLLFSFLVPSLQRNCGFLILLS